MRFYRLSLLALTTSIFINSSAHAAAFQLYELGTPIIGTADVGQAVVANDASISYFNPAGMTQIKSTQFMIGTQLIFPNMHFEKDSSNTIPGGNGGNAGQLLPGAAFYYVYNASPKLKLGASVTTPYGGAESYDNGWTGKYVLQTMQFYTMNFNPALAYQINPWVSVGAGASVEYANLYQTVALRIEGFDDGDMTLKATNFALGFNLGTLLTPTDKTKIGIAYRSRINHDLRGTSTFLRISSTPTVSSNMIMPQNIIISLSQALSNKFLLLGELGWSDWSSMKNTVVNIQNFTTTTPRHWNDTYRIGLGGQYSLTQAITVQAGASYDSSPTSSAYRLPDLPMDRQVRVGAGVLYSVIKAVKLGFSYEYINFGKASINNLSTAGRLSGSYSTNFANVVQASINVEC